MSNSRGATRGAAEPTEYGSIDTNGYGVAKRKGSKRCAAPAFKSQ